MSPSSWYQKNKGSTHRDQEVIAALNEIVTKHRRWGFWKYYHRLRHQGKNWNHKRVHRVYCAMKLNLPRRAKKRIPRREKQPLEVVKVPNEMWSMDFMHDSLYQGRCFRTLNIIGLLNYNEERPHQALNNLTPHQFSNQKLSA